MGFAHLYHFVCGIEAFMWVSLCLIYMLPHQSNRYIVHTRTRQCITLYILHTAALIKRCYCITGYMAFENDCYRIEVNNQLNWTTAQFTCETEGGHLASVMNSREQGKSRGQLVTEGS